MLANASNKPTAGGWFDTTGSGQTKSSPSTPTASKSGPPNLMSLQPRLSTGPGPKPLLSLDFSGSSSRGYGTWSNSTGGPGVSDDQRWEDLKWDGGAQFKRKLYAGTGIDVKKGMEQFEGEDEVEGDSSGWNQGSGFDLRQNSGRKSLLGNPSSFNSSMMGGSFNQMGSSPNINMMKE